MHEQTGPGQTGIENAMATFGPVIERVVNPIDTHIDCFLNLKTGEPLSPPHEISDVIPADESAARFLQPPAAMEAWLQQCGADVMCPSTGQAKLTLFDGFGVGVYGGTSASTK